MNSFFALCLALAALTAAQTSTQSTVVVTRTISRSSSRTSSTTLSAAQTTLSHFSPCDGPLSACVSDAQQTYYGAIVTSDATATVIGINAVVSRKPTQFLDSPITITQGANIYAINFPDIAQASCTRSSANATVTCVLTQPGVAGPTTTGPSGGINPTAVVTLTSAFPPSQIFSEAVVITSGADRLKASSSSSSGSSGSGSKTGTASGTTAAASASSTTTRSGAAGAAAVSLGSVFGAVALLSFVMGA